MVFTVIIYKSSSQIQKTAVTIIADSFEKALKKAKALYEENLISVIYEVGKN